MAERLVGKVVVVMGAGATPLEGWGNGRAAAVAFAREGATVVAVDLHAERAQETLAIIEGEGGAGIALQADVTNAQSVKAAIDRTLQLHGRIDVLHNNVGVAGEDTGSIERTTEGGFEREFAVNAKSVFLTMQAVLPGMIAQGKGVITNTSSILAVRFIRQPSLSYTAAKAAVEAMTLSVAASHGRFGIRTNCIRIGYMDTPLNRVGWRPMFKDRQAYDGAMAATAKAVPIGRMGTGFDTANAAVFLASDEASYLNGVILPVDGGVEHAPVQIAGVFGD